MDSENESEKRRNLRQWEELMSNRPLPEWSETDIRSWLTLRERANEERRQRMK